MVNLEMRWISPLRGAAALGFTATGPTPCRKFSPTCGSPGGDRHGWKTRVTDTGTRQVWDPARPHPDIVRSKLITGFQKKKNTPKENLGSISLHTTERPAAGQRNKLQLKHNSTYSQYDKWPHSLKASRFSFFVSLFFPRRYFFFIKFYLLQQQSIVKLHLN